MKALSITTVLVLTLAAGLWAFGLRDSLPAAAFGAGSSAAPAELLPYPGAEDLVVRRLLADADGLYRPSPDGRFMAHSMPDGNLGLLELRSGEVRALTDDGDIDHSVFSYGSSFSADGQRIAFTWTFDGNWDWALRIVDLGTGEVRQIFHQPETVQYIGLGSWSPDGEEIAVVLGMRDRSTRIALIRVSDGSPTVLRSFDWSFPGDLLFSPDGEWLAYDRAPDGDSDVRDIYFLARDGSREVRLIQGERNDQAVGWMPGGGPFFYLSSEGGRGELIAVEVENARKVSEPRVVRSDLWHIWPRGFSENAFFYVQMPERRKAYTARLDPDAGVLTSEWTPIAPASSMDWAQHLAWSPEGDRMAYFAGQSRTGLVIRSVTTGAERRLKSPFNVWATPEWSPVGDRLVLRGGDDQGRFGIHLLDLETLEAELLLRSDDEIANALPRWSRDGRAIYLVRREGTATERQILRLNLDTRQEREVFRTLGPLAYAVSPDERHLAVGRVLEESGDFQLVLVPLNGGEPRELARMEHAGQPPRGSAGVEWTPDGRHLVFGPPWLEGPAERSLWIVDRDGREVRQLTTFASGGGGALRPRIHPGGREISVVAGLNRWEIWTMENLRPAASSGRSGQQVGGR